MEVRVCPGCGRDFLPSTCEFHCGPVCCRKVGCRYAKPHKESQRRSVQGQRRCVVCGAHGDWFVKFAPCVPKKKGAPSGPPGCDRYHYWTLLDGHQYVCFAHRPEKPERIHVKYCSLQCYNSWKYGHQEQMRRKWRKHGRRTGEFRRNYARELKERGGKF